MLPRTHLAIDPDLVGRPLELAPGRATCALETTTQMIADDRGLVHGGFVFGLADYAAMVAVNDPYVVLSTADVRFTAPVAHPARLVATARVVQEQGTRHEVEVSVAAGESEVLRGRLTCLVLDRHVLDPREAR